jgi:hypothetical protein
MASFENRAIIDQICSRFVIHCAVRINFVLHQKQTRIHVTEQLPTIVVNEENEDTYGAGHFEKISAISKRCFDIVLATGRAGGPYGPSPSRLSDRTTPRVTGYSNL